MDAVEPFRGGMANRALLITEHRLPSRGVVDLLRIQVPIPDSIVCAPDCERVTLLAFPQFLLCPFALNELGNLARHVRHCFEQLVIRWPMSAAKKFQNSEHSILIKDWKAASSANACLQGQLGAAKHPILCEIRRPGRFAGFPDGPRAAFSCRELESPARRGEGFGVVRWKMADA